MEIFMNENKNNDNYENLFSTEAEDLDVSEAEENVDAPDTECPITAEEDTAPADDEAGDVECDVDGTECEDVDTALEVNNLEQEEAEEKKSKSGSTLLPIALIFLGVAIIFAVCIMYFMSGDKDEKNPAGDGTGSSVTTTDPSKNDPTAQNFIPGGDENANVKSVYTENFSFTNAEIAYAVMSSYQNILYNAQYYGGAAALGMDTSKSLKDQPCSFMGEGKTWFDYFLDGAKSTATEILSICEAAKAAGFEMPEDAKAALDSTLATHKSNAEKEGMTVEEYFKQNLGEVITPDVLRSVLEKSYYAQAYINDCVGKVDVSDTALEAAYNADPKIADKVDFVLLVLDPQGLLESSKETSAESSSDETAPSYTEAELEAALNSCRTEASEIAKAVGKEAFIQAAKNSLTTTFKMTSDDADNVIASCEYTGQAYADDPVIEKLFSIKDGETFVIEDEEGSVIYVGMLIKRNGKDETAATRSVRHILFKHDTYKDDTVVKQVYNEWVNGGATIEEFTRLAAEYSEDPGSKDNGGLYEGVKPGEMVDEFNDWLFDPARVVGDHAIVESKNFGWHIMYFEADGEPAWKTAVKTYLQNAESERVVVNATETYKPTVDDKILATVPA